MGEKAKFKEIHDTSIEAQIAATIAKKCASGDGAIGGGGATTPAPIATTVVPVSSSTPSATITGDSSGTPANADRDVPAFHTAEGTGSGSPKAGDFVL